MNNEKLPPTLDELKKIRKPLKNVYAETVNKLTAMDRIAVWITDHVGTMGFFLIILCWTIGWLSWNLLAPPELVFDAPMGFGMWLFMSNMIQLFLLPLIVVGQNIQSAHTELRAEHDLDVNIKAEREIEVIIKHLEYQNSLLLGMVSRLEKNEKESQTK